jgi:hypothetical protein
VQQGVDTVLIHSTKGLGADVFPADSPTTSPRCSRGGRRTRRGRRSSAASRAPVRLDLEGGATVTADAVVSGSASGRTSTWQRSASRSPTGSSSTRSWCTAATDVRRRDVAEYPDRILGRRRIEHVDNAEQMGRQVGRNLTGADEDYAHTPLLRLAARHAP